MHIFCIASRYEARMKARLIGAAVWGLANVLGVLAFLTWSASCCWIEPELKDVPGASAGAALGWAFGPFLIFAAFSLIDLAWAIVIAKRSIRRGTWASLAVPVFALLLWAATFGFDRMHHAS